MLNGANTDAAFGVALEERAGSARAVLRRVSCPYNIASVGDAAVQFQRAIRLVSSRPFVPARQPTGEDEASSASPFARRKRASP